MVDPSSPGKEEPDLYQVLGLPPDASRADIVHAYRRQARAVHPDAQPIDPEASARFRALTDAYDVLSDPVRRDAYDQQRAPATPPAPPAPPPAPPARPAPPVWLGRRQGPPGPDVPLWAGPVYIQDWADEDGMP